MFQNVLAGDGAPPLVAIWPKFVALRDSAGRFVRVLEVLAASRALRSAADLPRVAAFAAASRADFAAAFGPAVPDLELGVPVKLRWPPVGAARRPRLALDDLVDPANPHHHDPELLAASLLRILAREGMPGRRPGVARSA